jgi:hypothetical protein
MGKERKMCKVLVRMPKGKRPLGRLTHRWEIGIRMDLGQISWEGVEWIQLAEDRNQWWDVVNAVMNLRVLGP